MKKEKIHWFLVKKNDLHQKNNNIHLTISSIIHQWIKVLKFKKGERVVLFDGEGKLYKCEIQILEKKECVLKILEEEIKTTKNKKQINLFFGIPKKNNFELILEKGTEVGVTSFHPIITDRTEKLNINADRCEKILIEACEQSETPLLPPLGAVKHLEEVTPNLDPKNTFIFHTTGNKLMLDNFNFSNEVNLLIGPEGGWSPNEIEIFKNKNFKNYKIGENILKTETACIVIPFLFNVL